MFTFPNQRLTLKEKLSNDNEFGKKMVDFIGKFAYNTTFNYSDFYQNMLSNYRLFNNVINQKDFERDCNITGIDVGQFKDIILPYNKTYNKIQSLLSKEFKSSYIYTIALLDPNSIKRKEIAKSDMLKSYIEADLNLYIQQYQIKKLNKLKEEIAQKGESAQSQEELDQIQEQLKLAEQEAQEYLNSLVPPTEIEKWHSTKYRESREIAASNIMDYLNRTLKIAEKRNDGFKHAMIGGLEVIYVGTNDTEIVVENVNNLHFFYHKSPDIKYIQDGLYAGTRRYMTVVDVLQKYPDLSKDNYEKLTKKTNSFLGGAENTKLMSYPTQNATNSLEESFFMDISGDYYEEGQFDRRRGSEIQVLHVEWVSEQNVGFITFKDENGVEEVKIVDENFQLPPDATKEKKENGKECYYFSILNPETNTPIEFKYEESWIKQVWEGTRIGADIYHNVRPKKYSYFSSFQPHKHKLGYHGVIYSNMNAQPVSLMDRMRPFQYLYFFLWHKLKKLVASDKAKLLHLNTTMLPDKMTYEKAIYYMDELNINFYNPLKNMDAPGAYQNSLIPQATDRSNMQHIMSYIELLNYVDLMISDAAGISKPIEGQTTTNQAVTNAQSDIVQSSLVTEVYFTIHQSLWEDILNSLLSVSRKFYKDNRIRNLQYVLDDLSIKTIEISEDDLEDCDLGLFMTDAVKDNYVFETLKQISQALIQNDKANLTHVISMLESKSLAELKREVKAFEKEQSQAAQAEQDAKIKMQKDAMDYARETMIIKENLTTQRELEKAKIDVFKFQKDLDVNNNGVPDPLEIEKLKIDKNYNDEEIKIKNKELELKNKEIDNKLEIEKIKARNKKKE